MRSFIRNCKIAKIFGYQLVWCPNIQIWSTLPVLEKNHRVEIVYHFRKDPYWYRKTPIIKKPKTNPVNLGKKTLFWRLTLWILKMNWDIMDESERRDWNEVKHGSIPHKCQFNYKKAKFRYFDVSGKVEKFYPCRHWGCNTIEPCEEWLTGINKDEY